MSDFKAKMYQIVCRLGLRPRSRWGSLQRSPKPPSWILGGLLLRGRGRDKRRREGGEGKGRKRERGREGRGREGKGREGAGKAWPPITIFLAPALRECTVVCISHHWRTSLVFSTNCEVLFSLISTVFVVQTRIHACYLTTYIFQHNVTEPELLICQVLCRTVTSSYAPSS